VGCHPASLKLDRYYSTPLTIENILFSSHGFQENLNLIYIILKRTEINEVTEKNDNDNYIKTEITQTIFLRALMCNPYPK
jgi:hypothetical protein